MLAYRLRCWSLLYQLCFNAPFLLRSGSKARGIWKLATRFYLIFVAHDWGGGGGSGCTTNSITIPSKHETLAQCWHTDPSSTTLGQQSTNVSPTSHVCWSNCRDLFLFKTHALKGLNAQVKYITLQRPA